MPSNVNHMTGESEPRPIQENLFPNRPKQTESENPPRFEEEVVEVDRERNRVIIMVDGYEFTCALRDGEINFDAFIGETNIKDIPPAVRAQAKERAREVLETDG
jgi:hypothetical protein